MTNHRKDTVIRMKFCQCSLRWLNSKKRSSRWFKKETIAQVINRLLLEEKQKDEFKKETFGV